MNKKLFRTLYWALSLLIILLGACKLSLDPYKPQHGAAGVKFSLGNSSNNNTTNRAILSNSGYLYLVSVKKEGATTIHGPFTPDSNNTIVIDNLEAGEYDHLFVFYSAKEFNLQKTLEKIDTQVFNLELDSHPSLEATLTNKNVIDKLAQTYASKSYLLDFITDPLFSDIFTGLESTNQTEQYISLLSHYFNGSTVFGQKSNLNLKAGKTETLALTLLPFANLQDIGPSTDAYTINVQSEQEIERFISLPIATIFGESNTNFAIELANSSDATLSDFALYNQNGTKQEIDFSGGITSFNSGESLEYTANLSKVTYFYVRFKGSLNVTVRAKPNQSAAALTFINVAHGIESYPGHFYVGFANEENSAIQGWREASKNGDGKYSIETLEENYQGKDMYLLYSLDEIIFEEEIGNDGKPLEELLKNKDCITALLDEIAAEASNEEALLLKLNGRALITHLGSSENTQNATIDLNSDFALRPIVASGEVSGNYYGEILIEPEGEEGVDVLYSKPKFVKFSIENASETYWADCAIQNFFAFTQVLLYDSTGKFLKPITKTDSAGYKKIDLLLNQTNSEFYVFIDGTPEQGSFYTSISVYEPQFVSNSGQDDGKTPDSPTTIQKALENLETASNPIVFLTQGIELDSPLMFNTNDVPVGNYSKLTITSWNSETSSIASQALHRISPSSNFDGFSFLNFTVAPSNDIMMSFKYIHIGPEIKGQPSNMPLVVINSDKVTLDLENCVLQNNDNWAQGTLSFGGAIYVASGNLNISDTIIENCAANAGGAIYFKGKDFILYPGTEITNCKVVKGPDAYYGNGGGIYVGGTATLYLHSGTSITGNHAANLGGGIYLEKSVTKGTGDSWIIDGVTDNTATTAGEDPNIYEEPDI